MCEEWASFENFFRDMGERPTPKHQIDRTDNSRGYSPDNCKWVTQQENLCNRRSNRIVQLNGASMTASEAARITGLSQSGVVHRLIKGIPIESPKKSNKLHLVRGKMMDINEASAVLGIAKSTLQGRLKRNIPIDAPIKRSSSSRNPSLVPQTSLL